MKEYKSSEITKLKMCESLKVLLSEKTLDEITIKEIVDGCRLNRQSFYYHFSNINDIVLYMFSNEAKNAFSIRPNEEIKKCFIRALHYIDDNRKMFNNAFGSIDINIIRQSYYSSIAKYVRDRVESVVTALPVTTNEKEFVIHFLSISVGSFIESWIYNEIKVSPEEAIDIVERLIEDLILGLKLKYLNQ